jgi:hypothetical protein
VLQELSTNIWYYNTIIFDRDIWCHLNVQNSDNRNFTKSRKFASKWRKVDYLAIKENTYMYEFSKIILVHKCSILWVLNSDGWSPLKKKVKSRMASKMLGFADVKRKITASEMQCTCICREIKVPLSTIIDNLLHRAFLKTTNWYQREIIENCTFCFEFWKVITSFVALGDQYIGSVKDDCG